MAKRVQIHNRRRVNWHNVFELQKMAEESVKYWREVGLESLVKEFKDFVKEL